jgi:crotonobetainyl-CoA:carnitine CoA-transferase CaiB-like acyl-CoA transferase
MTAASILEDILAQAKQPPANGSVEFIGADPVFPTTFRMADFGAAAIGAAALQAVRLHEEHTGEYQEVKMPVEAAAAAMRSFRYLKGLSETAAPGRIVSAFYETADDRWIFLHRASQDHFKRQLAVLGCQSDESSVVAAIRRWKAEVLEEAVMAAGACAAMVRSPAEWAKHEQAKAIAGLPLFTIAKIGESDPIPVGTQDRPLGGLRVLDLTRVLAGPTTSRTLAEHGADVLRICSPLHPDGGSMPPDTGHGKRSTILDLRKSAATGILRKLVAGADVFSQGYRPGALGKLGFAPEDLAAIRPGIVSVAISTFGSAGPWKDKRGYDSIVEAGSGIAYEAGGGDGHPGLIPASPLDYTSGYLAAFLVEVALGLRARDGGSYHIELSLSQTGQYLNGLSRVDAAAAALRPAELEPAAIEGLMMGRDTPYGHLRYLKPAAQLSGTPPRWDRPTVPAAFDEPEWQ